MRYVLAIAISCLVGCHAQIADESPNSDDRAEARVRRWLDKNTYVVNGNHPSSDIRIMEWDQWIDEGRKIDGIEPVLRSMLVDNDPGTDSRLIARSLGVLGDANSVAVLLECLSCEDDYLRIEAAVALGHLKDRRAVFPLGRCLTVEADVNVKLNIVGALGRIGGMDAMHFLQIAASDDNAYVSADAKEILAKYDTD